MPPNTPQNQLLARLATRDFEALRPHLRAIDLPVRYEMEHPDRNIEHVYFPDAGIASVVAVQAGDMRVEVGLIGREGMTGTSVVLGNHQSPNQTYIQVAGSGQRMASDILRTTMANNTALHAVMLKYVQAFLVQTAQTAISNARHHIDARLSRWVLMAHDRTDSATIPLTHEFMALMLGVRRAGVTQAVQALVKQGLIQSARGEVRVLDREGLEASAGDSYGVPEREYRRLLGGGDKDARRENDKAKARP